MNHSLSIQQCIHGPRPKSPPEYAVLYGRRREAAKLQILEGEISFLEDELRIVDSFQISSRCCKELTDFVVATSDPFIPTTKKTRKSCRFWKWLCGVFRLNFSWVCCCCYTLCSPEMPCSCNPCVGLRKSCCSCNLCVGSCKSCFSCSIPKSSCCSCPSLNCCTCKEIMSCCCCWYDVVSIPSCSCSCSCSFPGKWKKCSWPKLKCWNCFKCKDMCCSCNCNCSSCNPCCYLCS